MVVKWYLCSVGTSSENLKDHCQPYQTKNGVEQSVTLADGHCVRHTVTKIHHEALQKEAPKTPQVARPSRDTGSCGPTSQWERRNRPLLSAWGLRLTIVVAILAQATNKTHKKKSLSKRATEDHVDVRCEKHNTNVPCHQCLMLELYLSLLTQMLD